MKLARTAILIVRVNLKRREVLCGPLRAQQVAVAGVAIRGLHLQRHTMRISKSSSMSRALGTLFPALFGVAAVCYVSTAEAQSVIKRPGAHPRYSLEIEPHLAFQVHRVPANGIGPGVRFNIPLFHNGPIPKINNNMAIGFGPDLLFWDENRGRFGCGGCDGTVIWFPVVAQWNFYLTDIISVFGEPGLAARYIDFDRGDDFDPFEFVFWGGGRFQFGETVGLTVRVGTPYISVGANFLL